jgi:hypothetical protein
MIELIKEQLSIIGANYSDKQIKEHIENKDDEIINKIIEEEKLIKFRRLFIEKVLEEKMLKTDFNIGFELECFFASEYEKYQFWEKAQNISNDFSVEMDINEDIIDMGEDCSIKPDSEYTECPNCYGNRSVECDFCHAGLENCPTCDGEGYIDNEEGGLDDCPTCGGSGQSPCENCGGTGEQTCYVCGGEGNIDSSELSAEFGIGGSTGLPFNTKTLMYIKNLMKLFFQEGGMTNETTGFHTHISYPDISAKELFWVLLNIAKDDKTLEHYKNLFSLNTGFASYSDLNEANFILTKTNYDNLKVLDLIKELFVSQKDKIFYAFNIHHGHKTLEWRAVRDIEDMSDVNNWIKVLNNFLNFINKAKDVEFIAGKNFLLKKSDVMKFEKGEFEKGEFEKVEKYIKILNVLLSGKKIKEEDEKKMLDYLLSDIDFLSNRLIPFDPDFSVKYGSEPYITHKTDALEETPDYFTRLKRLSQLIIKYKGIPYYKDLLLKDVMNNSKRLSPLYLRYGINEELVEKYKDQLEDFDNTIYEIFDKPYGIKNTPITYKKETERIEKLRNMSESIAGQWETYLLELKPENFVDEFIQDDNVLEFPEYTVGAYIFLSLLEGLEVSKEELTKKIKELATEYSADKKGFYEIINELWMEFVDVKGLESLDINFEMEDLYFDYLYDFMNKEEDLYEDTYKAYKIYSDKFNNRIDIINVVLGTPYALKYYENELDEYTIKQRDNQIEAYGIEEVRKGEWLGGRGLIWQDGSVLSIGDGHDHRQVSDWNKQNLATFHVGNRDLSLRLHNRMSWKMREIIEQLIEDYDIEYIYLTIYKNNKSIFDGKLNEWDLFDKIDEYI